MRSLFLAAALVAAPAALPATAAAQAPAPVRRAAFHDGMRQLWEDHIVWTRLFIVSAVAGLPDADATAQRLLKNQADIGSAIATFYGDAAGTRLTALLREHILTAARLVTAAKTGDTSTVRTASAAWTANADSISAFLGAANHHHWSRAALQAEMRMHLDLTLREATARLRGDWAADIAAYDEIHRHILGLADVLSDGIIKQFPARFN